MRTATKYDTYCQSILDLMVEECSMDGDTMIWEGSLTKLVREVTNGKGHYGNISNRLRSTKAITELKRGGGGTYSMYEVHRTKFMVDDEGNEITWNAPDYMYQSPTRRNETQLISFGQRVNDIDQRVEMLIVNMVALAREVHELTQWRDAFVRGQTVSTEQDSEAEGGDGAGSGSAPEHGIHSLRVVETGEDLGRRLGLTSDPTIPGSA